MKRNEMKWKLQREVFISFYFILFLSFWTPFFISQSYAWISVLFDMSVKARTERRNWIEMNWHGLG